MAFGFQPMQMPNVLGDLGSNLARSAQATTPEANPAAYMPMNSKPMFTTGDVKATLQRITGQGPASSAMPAADAGATAAGDAGAGAAESIGSGGGSIFSNIISALFGG